jgi:SAM-dependent methyltransferase
MSRLNLDTYNDQSVVNWYNSMTGLTPLEKQVFEMNAHALGHVLDIGIGGGRTTAYLLDKCDSYTGIDYSKGFAELVGQKYPKADIRHMDARNLEAFADKSFDLVNFSFNGIDYVDLDGRKKILAEIYRVLKPGGIFFFSTHNKNHPTFNKPAWSNPANSFFVNLKTFIKLLPHLPTHFKYQKHEHIQKEYAIINDSAHNYSLLTFYTTPAFLREQLAEYGFSGPVLYSGKGMAKTDEELDDWIFVTAVKLPS